jgi:formylglycine-generating enzyme required for sulfatase activity
MSPSPAERPAEVWFIGRLDVEWYIPTPTKTGAVNRIEVDRIWVDGLEVSAGTSGAPLLAKSGIVGMITHDTPGEISYATPIDVIQRLFKDWGYPWQLTPLRRIPVRELPKILTAKDGKEMLLVPEGEFEMGSTPKEADDAYQLGRQYYSAAQKSMFEVELPRHQVWLEAFYMDRYEVTVGEYTAFLRATGRQGLPDDVATYVAMYASGAQYPVVGVSWDEAEAYCRWAGKQLPTEAQWEKAARGTDGRQYPWGNAPIDGRHANYCDSQCIGEEWRDTHQNDGYQYTAPVGSYSSGQSPYGIEDLAGNALEWVQDWYTDDYYRRSPNRNPVNNTPTGLRVLRGGGWRYPPPVLRTTFRFKSEPDVRGPARGFRCVVRAAAFRP